MPTVNFGAKEVMSPDRGEKAATDKIYIVVLKGLYFGSAVLSLVSKPFLSVVLRVLSVLSVNGVDTVISGLNRFEEKFAFERLFEVPIAGSFRNFKDGAGAPD
jgi:hypothetical protein